MLNLLDKCELAFDEATYPIAANAFNGVELALSVIRHIADSADEQQALFLELCECFGESHQHSWQQVVDIGHLPDMEISVTCGIEWIFRGIIE